MWRTRRYVPAPGYEDDDDEDEDDGGAYKKSRFGRKFKDDGAPKRPMSACVT